MAQAVKINDGVQREYSFCRAITNQEGDNLEEWTEGEVVATVDGDGKYNSEKYPDLLKEDVPVE